MEDIKSIVAKNITELRLLNNMTQMELAEKLNYSDKTISKWERAESSPDIAVLVDIADLFGVSLDYLVRTENIEETVKENKQKETKYNRRVISYISESVALFIAIFAFIITSLITKEATFQWLYNLFSKPWCYDGIQYGEEFWKYAEDSGYLDEIKAYKAAYTEEKKKADSECLELLVRRGSEIPDNEVTFKKLFDAGVKIRL